MAEKHLFTSESVTEGHPDKVADQISDSILDAMLTDDEMSRVACEVMVTTGVAFLALDPPREVPEGEGLVLSPADGRIVQVGKARDDYIGRDAIKISVFMNVFNVHSNRAPVDGTVENVWYFPGSFVNADLDKASLENERNAMHQRTAQGVDVTSVQVAGLIARRILCYVGKGDRLARGQRYGFIRFGSRVDVYLPPGSRPLVAIGDRVSATSTVLAELPRSR